MEGGSETPSSDRAGRAHEVRNTEPRALCREVCPSRGPAVPERCPARTAVLCGPVSVHGGGPRHGRSHRFRVSRATKGALGEWTPRGRKPSATRGIGGGQGGGTQGRTSVLGTGREAHRTHANPRRPEDRRWPAMTLGHHAPRLNWGSPTWAPRPFGGSFVFAVGPVLGTAGRLAASLACAQEQPRSPSEMSPTAAQRPQCGGRHCPTGPLGFRVPHTHLGGGRQGLGPEFRSPWAKAPWPAPPGTLTC